MALTAEEKEPLLKQLKAEHIATRNQIINHGINSYASLIIAIALEYFLTIRAEDNEAASIIECLEQALVDISQPDARPVVVDLVDELERTYSAIVAISKGGDSIED